MFSDLAETAFLAPRWVEGLIQKEVRFASRATGLSYLMGRRGPGYWGPIGEGMAKGLGAYFLATQAINLATKGHFTWDNEEEGHKMDAWIPAGDTGFWLSPLSVFAEVSHDVVRLTETKPRFWDAITQIGENKLGPIGKMMLILGTHKSPQGEQYSTTAGELKGAAQQLTPFPIAFGYPMRAAGHALLPEGIAPDAPQPGSFFRQMVAGAAGMKVEKGKTPLSQMSAKARDFAVQNGYNKETGWQEVMTDEPSYSKLRQALRNGDQKEAQHQWSELTKNRTPEQVLKAMKIWAKRPLTGSAAGERAFIWSLDTKDLERYSKANDQRMQELEKFYDFYQRQ
jgi:hypothetical protein